MTDPVDAAQREAIRVEIVRVHESAVFSAQGQFEAAKLWRMLHWSLGALTAGFSTTAAVVTFAADVQTVSGALAVTAAISAAVLTGIRPDNLAQRAQNSGNAYTTLRNDARRLRDIGVPTDPVPELREALTKLAARASELDHASDPIPRWAYRLAKRNIERDGGQTFEADRI
ncbi:SLATT domain-containing protein [Nocardiopsis alborubida]|uniref:SLATT domain-containing protein n=1 Tax=Nocardiopsis alborubida TaxID=146802 RepID=A0A7X6M9H2_9ACTN|nr:SLATT domain-containing protein [Nocardiopsis alborubida]NKY97056.1 SLATT domain-containing protein [Nocardiopsis alborubida]